MAIEQYQQKAIAVLNDYPPEKYNLLIPVESIQEISPLHRVIVNIVRIDPVPDRGKDCYPEKNGGLALTKKGLNKLMAGANIQVIDSRAVVTHKCQRCMEIARTTKLSPRCGDCPAADDVAIQVVIAIPEPSGTWRMVRATKELRVADEKLAMSDKQYKQFFPYRSEHCETKALNRAIRAGLMVKANYTPKELEKPFAVALVVPNMADPEMKKAAAARYATSSMALFPGQQPQLPENAGEGLKQLPSGMIDIPADEHDDEQPGGVDDPPWEDPPSEDNPLGAPIFCGDCGQVIEATRVNGKDWTPEAIRDYSVRHYGTSLCPECQRNATPLQGGGRR
ncbi:MAG: hypothetical protein ABSC17_09800 [Thermacetogeniaceae bacterium]